MRNLVPTVRSEALLSARRSGGSALSVVTSSAPRGFAFGRTLGLAVEGTIAFGLLISPLLLIVLLLITGGAGSV